MDPKNTICGKIPLQILLTLVECVTRGFCTTKRYNNVAKSLF